MNIPNKLTMIRISLIPIFLGILYSGIPYNHYVAAAVFIIAAMTDIADGVIARKHGLVTDFGKLFDPIADKLLVFAAIFWFVEQGSFPAWAALIIIVREFLIQGIRVVAGVKGEIIAAGLSGKIKTLVTMIVLPFMFLPFAEPFKIYINWENIAPWFNGICVSAIVITTIISGVDYVIKNKDVLNMEV